MLPYSWQLDFHFKVVDTAICTPPQSHLGALEKRLGQCPHFVILDTLHEQIRDICPIKKLHARCSSKLLGFFISRKSRLSD